MNHYYCTYLLYSQYACYSQWLRKGVPLVIHIIILLGCSSLLLCTSVQGQVPDKQWDKAYGGDSLDILAVMIPTIDHGYLLGGSSFSKSSQDKSAANLGGEDYWLIKTDSSGTKQWDKTFGGAGADRVSSLLETKDGGYLVAGMSTSAASGDKSGESKGSADFWLIKLDSTGTKLWDKTFGGEGYDQLPVLTKTGDGGYLLAGSSTSGTGGDKTQDSRGGADYWLIRLDSSGTKLWDKTFGGSRDDLLTASIQTVGNNILLAGFSTSDSSADKSETGWGRGDYWMVLLDSSGTKLWDKTFGGNDLDVLSSIVETKDGGYLLSGHSFSSKSGDKMEDSRGGADYWLIRLDSVGTKLWDKTFGGNDLDVLSSIVETKDGGYLLSGYSSSVIGEDKSAANLGGEDYWLIKTDSSGTKQWDKTFGGAGADRASSLLETREEKYIIGGSSTSAISGDRTEDSRGGSDFWLIQIVYRSGPEPLLPAIQINFQDVYTNTPQGWIKDYGLPFSEKTVTIQEVDSIYRYGWKRRDDQSPVDLSVGGFLPGNGRSRPDPSDSLLSTLMHMQGNDIENFNGIPVEAYWELALANGDYQVIVSVGDGSVWSASESHSINIEGIKVIDTFVPTGTAGSLTRFKSDTLQVRVTDGLLTLDADGGRNTKVNYIIIQPLRKSDPVVLLQEPIEVVAEAKAYPNPFTEELTIRTHLTGTLTVSVFDRMGKIYYQTKQQVNSNESLLPLRLQNLPAGFYLIKLGAENGLFELNTVIKK